MAGRKHGSNGQIKMDPAGTIPGTPTLVADLSAWTLDMARDQVDVTAFADVNKQYVLGLPDVKGTYAGWWNSASSPALFDVAQGTTPVTLNLVPSTDEATFYFEGLAYLDASINCPATGAVSISGNFVAAGPWSLQGGALALAAAAARAAAAATKAA
jgi:hypothetical protein